MHKDAFNYELPNGTEILDAITFRKCKQLSIVSFPNGIRYIGDSAFSFCTSLKQLSIPESIKFIGVAAFCCSGLEEVIFEGVPEIIEPAVFKGCKNLKRIIVPKGQKLHFYKVLDIDSSIIFEADESQKPEEKAFTNPIPTNRRLSRPTTLTYNFNNFKWYVGDNVSLDDLFSGPTVLIGNPSYQFRRKALFVFMHSDIANQLGKEVEYEIPANAVKFMQRYQEKYSNKSPRIFLFVCDDGKKSQFYDEVKLVRANRNSITIKSLLRI